jgi:hypothetical protein
MNKLRVQIWNQMAHEEFEAMAASEPISRLGQFPFSFAHRFW